MKISHVIVLLVACLFTLINAATIEFRQLNQDPSRNNDRNFVLDCDEENLGLPRNFEEPASTREGTVIRSHSKKVDCIACSLACGIGCCGCVCMLGCFYLTVVIILSVLMRVSDIKILEGWHF